MFSSDVSQAVRLFETQTLQSNGSPFYPSARISVTTCDLMRAEVLSQLCSLCNPSPDQYGFVASRPEGDRQHGLVTLFTKATKAGEKVNSEFMNIFRKNLCDFAATLASSWVPYKKPAGKLPRAFPTVDTLGILISKKASALDETGYVNSCLVAESGCNVEWGQIEEKGSKECLDLIAGSEKDVWAYVDYIRNVGKSLQAELESSSAK